LLHIGCPGRFVIGDVYDQNAPYGELSGRDTLQGRYDALEIVEVCQLLKRYWRAMHSELD